MGCVTVDVKKGLEWTKNAIKTHEQIILSLTKEKEELDDEISLSQCIVKEQKDSLADYKDVLEYLEDRKIQSQYDAL